MCYINWTLVAGIFCVQSVVMPRHCWHKVDGIMPGKAASKLDIIYSNKVFTCDYVITFHNHPDMHWHEKPGRVHWCSSLHLIVFSFSTLHRALWHHTGGRERGWHPPQQHYTERQARRSQHAC